MTPAEFAQTINPRRDAVLRSRNGSEPQPAATGPEYSNPKPLERTQNWIKLGGNVIHHFTQVCLSRASKSPGRWHQWFDDGPFDIG